MSSTPPTLPGALRRAWFDASDEGVLYVFPVLASLLSVDALPRAPTDQLTAITFGFPGGVVRLQSFLSMTPSTGIRAWRLVLVVPVVLGLLSVLTAAYLGRLYGTLSDRTYTLPTAIRAHGRPLGVIVVGSGLLWRLAGLFVETGGRMAAAVLLPVALAVGYLFYAAPYLVVVRNDGALDALVGSYAFATRSRRYLVFGLQYCLATAVVSVPVSLAAYSAGVVGVAAALLVVSPVAVALDGATMLFVDELVDARE